MSQVQISEVVRMLRESSTRIRDLGGYQPQTYTELADRIEAHGIAPKDGWVLVPVELTKEMVNAAECAFMPFGDMELAIKLAILSAPKPEDV